MNNMTTYDARDVTTVVDGVIITGFQDGDMVSFSKDNNNAEIVVDAQGNGAMAVNNNNLGTFVINLSAGSPFNKKLTQLADSRKQFAMSVKHKTERAWGTKCVVEKTADGSFGTGVGARSYTVKALDYKREYK